MSNISLFKKNSLKVDLTVHASVNSNIWNMVFTYIETCIDTSSKFELTLIYCRLHPVHYVMVMVHLNVGSVHVTLDDTARNVNVMAHRAPVMNL